MVFAFVLFGGLVAWWLPATIVSAASLSGQPTKMTVYQGVAAIAPTVWQVMELGNNGSDIASSSGLNLLPGANGVVYIGAQEKGAGTHEGGEIILLPPTSTGFQWHIDTYDGVLRFFRSLPSQVGVTAMTINDNGDTHITGHLCLSGTCIAGWQELGGGPSYQSIEGVLSRGNGSNRPMIFNQQAGATPIYGGATALVESTTAPSNPSYNGLYVLSDIPIGDGNGVPLYGENANGYAGYFSGNVTVNPSWEYPGYSGFNFSLSQYNILQMGGVVEPVENRFGPANPMGGYMLEVINSYPTIANPTGSAARFTGAVSINGGYEADYALQVTSSRPTGVTMKAYSPASPAYGPAILATGATPGALAGSTAAGIIADSGGGAGTSYGGFFRGHTVVEGIAYMTGSAGPLTLSGSARHKSTTEVQVCDVNADTCLGKYVYTCSGTACGGGSAIAKDATTKFCYEDPVNYTTACVNAYGALPNYELR